MAGVDYLKTYNYVRGASVFLDKLYPVLCECDSIVVAGRPGKLAVCKRARRTLLMCMVGEPRGHYLVLANDYRERGGYYPPSTSRWAGNLLAWSDGLLCGPLTLEPWDASLVRMSMLALGAGRAGPMLYLEASSGRELADAVRLVAELVVEQVHKKSTLASSLQELIRRLAVILEEGEEALEGEPYWPCERVCPL